MGQHKSTQHDRSGEEYYLLEAGVCLEVRLRGRQVDTGAAVLDGDVMGNGSAFCDKVSVPLTQIEDRKVSCFTYRRP